MNGPDAGAGRAGVSAPEALVALLLGLFVVHLGFTTLERLRDAEDRMASRTDGLVAMRVARHVLRRELGNGRPGVDWSVDADSISIRAFRGTALLCPRDSATVSLTVEYSGDRRADPSKDSVVLVDAVGAEVVRALADVSMLADPCGTTPGTDLQTWLLDAPVSPHALVARLFERGSYHVSGSALRYRRGGSGRQPLTPEVWSAATAWTRTGDRLGLEAHHRDGAAGPGWSAFLAWTDGP